MVALARGVIAALVLLASAPPALAHHEIGAIGPSGDAQHTAKCGPGEELRGFRGRSGVWIDQIQILCAARKADGNFERAHPADWIMGGNGGADQSAECYTDQKLTGFWAYRSLDHKRIVQIQFECSGKTKNLIFGNDAYGAGQPLEQIQGNCARYSEDLVGLVVNYGNDVNGIGYVCDIGAVSTPPKPVSTPARPPVSTGPGVAMRATVAGMWSFTRGSETYRLQMVAQGTGLAVISNADIDMIPVAGNLTNTSGDTGKDGGFSGQMMANRQVLINYSQKNGGHGTCLLTYSGDAKTLAGQCSDETGQSFNFNGNRAP